MCIRDRGCLTNGYQAERAARLLADASDFINVSVKAFDDDFYRDYVDVEGLGPVLRNVAYYHGRTHLEVTTPIVAGLNDDHILRIAKWLGDIDTSIPVHVFRLLPEYKMADREYPDILQLAGAIREARMFLDHIYFGNFAGSQWLSTYCPCCVRRLIERVGLGGCGAKPVVVLPKQFDAPDEDQQFYGAYSTYSGIKDQTFDFYWLGYQSDRPMFAGEQPFAMQTVGSRWTTL